MAYEKLNLVYALMSGEIYLTRILKNGAMSDSRRIITKECIRATTEWFIGNKKVMVAYPEQADGKQPTLFYTDDKDKAKKILEILKEEDVK